MVVRWMAGSRAKLPAAALALVLLAAPLAVLAAQPTASPASPSQVVHDPTALDAAQAGIDLLPSDFAKALHRFEPTADPTAGSHFVAYTADGLVILTRDALLPLRADGLALPGIQFLGVAAGHADPAGQGLRQAYSAQYLGDDPSAWRPHVPHFEAVRYAGLWPGIDLVVRLDAAGHLEFDHVAAPGADLDAIRFAAPDGMLAPDGRLAFGPAQSAQLDAPVSFDGAGTPVASRFVRHGDGSFGYAVGPRDPTLGVTIDPILRFESYSGGSAADANHDIAVALHPSDPDLFRVYVAGEAQSGTQPSSFGTAVTVGASSAMMAAQLIGFDYDPVTHEATPLAVVHYGGSQDDRALRVAVSNDQIILAGETESTNIPLLFPVQADSNTVPPTYTGGANTGGAGTKDWFVVRFSPAFVMNWGTYLGGGGDDLLVDMAVDVFGNVALLGHGETPPGPKFPTKFAYSDTPFGKEDVLLAVVVPDASPPVLEFATYLGDASTDLAGGVAMDLFRVWVGMSHDTETGLGTAGAMATPGSFMPFESTADPNQGSALVMRINRGFPNGFEWATYLGGSGYERVSDLLVSGGRVWVTGTTTSADFPTCDNDVDPVPVPPAQQPAPPAPPISLEPCIGVPVLQRNFSEGPTVLGDPGAFTDGFITQITPDGSQLVYSSYISTKLDWVDPDPAEMSMDRPVSLVRDPIRGHLVVLGITDSGGFEPYYPAYTAPNPPPYPAPSNQWDFPSVSGPAAFLLRFQPGAANAVPFSSFYLTDGGDAIEQGEMAIDFLGNLYLPGLSASTDVLAGPGFQASSGGGGADGTISIIGMMPPTTTLRAIHGTDLVPSDQDIAQVTLPTGNLPVMLRNAGELVALDVVGSYPGDYPLSTANYRWWLYDADGVTVLDSDTGAAVPSFSPVTMTYQGERIVCAQVRDDGPTWHPDGGDTQCVRLVFDGPPPPDFEVRSTAFNEGGTIPITYTCDGSSISPPIHFVTLPAGATHLALQVRDLDNGGYVHWAWWDLPVATPSIPGDVNPTAAGITLAENSDNDAAYAPLCTPQAVEHEFEFVGFALDAPIGLPAGSSVAAMNAAMAGHIVRVDTLKASYQRIGATPPAGAASDDDEPFIDPADVPPMPGSEPSFTALDPQGPQVPAVAFAGSDIAVASGAPVVLDGTGSVSAAAYAWRQLGASTVVLQGAASAKATFAAPAASSAGQTLQFQLTVTGADGSTSTDEVDVIVQPALAVVSSDAEAFTKAFRSNQPGLLHTWDFGDGSSSGEQAPKHRYDGPGKYTVKLTVAAGAYTASTQVEVTVEDERGRDPQGTAGSGTTVPTAEFPMLALLALIPGIALVALAVFLWRRRRGSDGSSGNGPTP